MPVYLRDILALMKDSIEFNPAIIHHEICYHDSILTFYAQISGSIEVEGQKLGINTQFYVKEIEEIFGPSMRSYNTIDSLRSDFIDLKKNVLDKINKDCTIREVTYRIERDPSFYIQLLYSFNGITYRMGCVCYRRNYHCFHQQYESLKLLVRLMKKHGIDKKYFNKNDTVAVERGYKWSFGQKVVYDERKSTFFGYHNDEVIKVIK